MDCDEYQKFIDRSLDGELDEAGARVLEKHLARCSECMGSFDQAKKLKACFKPSSAAPPSSLRPRILAALKTEAAGRTAEIAGVILLFRRAAVAALIFLTVSAGFFFGGLRPLTASDRKMEIHFEDLFSQRKPEETIDILFRTTTLKEAMRLAEQKNGKSGPAKNRHSDREKEQ